jgi:hypothetical protein
MLPISSPSAKKSKRKPESTLESLPKRQEGEKIPISAPKGMIGMTVSSSSSTSAPRGSSSSTSTATGTRSTSSSSAYTGMSSSSSAAASGRMAEQSEEEWNPELDLQPFLTEKNESELEQKNERSDEEEKPVVSKKKSKKQGGKKTSKEDDVKGAKEEVEILLKGIDNKIYSKKEVELIHSAGNLGIKLVEKYPSLFKEFINELEKRKINLTAIILNRKSGPKLSLTYKCILANVIRSKNQDALDFPKTKIDFQKLVTLIFYTFSVQHFKFCFRTLAEITPLQTANQKKDSDINNLYFDILPYLRTNNFKEDTVNEFIIKLQHLQSLKYPFFKIRN